MSRLVVRTFYVGQILISPTVAQKIQAKHGVTPDEVRELYGKTVPGAWDDDPLSGRRLYVVFRTSTGRKLKIVLEPIDWQDGTWGLRTAIASR
jgi:hypothetical protein